MPTVSSPFNRRSLSPASACTRGHCRYRLNYHAPDINEKLLPKDKLHAKISCAFHPHKPPSLEGGIWWSVLPKRPACCPTAALGRADTPRRYNPIRNIALKLIYAPVHRAVTLFAGMKGSGRKRLENSGRRAGGENSMSMLLSHVGGKIFVQAKVRLQRALQLRSHSGRFAAT